MKKVLIVVLCFLIVSTAFSPVTASTNREREEATVEKAGLVAAKDEVVYAALHPDGTGEEIYVVNSLDVIEAGRVVDHGSYTNVKNLTDLSEIHQSGDTVELTAPEGKFYYQGDLNHTDLPWEFTVDYFLDGQRITPEQLAGKDGRLEIQINTSANESVNPVFFENYLLQISFALDGEHTRNVETEDGTIANAGKDIQVTFTIMPEEEAELSVTADVEAFELSGIDITAVPQNMTIEPPDTEEFTDDIATLADALQEIDKGVLELKNGTNDLHEGTTALSNGSTEYKAGITALDSGSAELVSGSSAIKEALKAINGSLSAADEMELGDIGKVTEGLTELADGLREIEDGLSMLNDNYSQAFKALDGAMNNIPTHQLSEEEIGRLMQHEETRQTAGKLLEVYEASLTAKGTYDQVKEAFFAVTGTLDTVTDSLGTMIDSIEEINQGFSGLMENANESNGLSELQKGLSTLSANYKTFHQGLISYTNGVGELASSYEDLDTGISDLNAGTGEMADGVADLREGTYELADATSDMPEQVTEEIDEMLAQYDRSDFEAVSFVSDKNEEVNNVQFVLKTEPIEMEEPEVEEQQEEEEKSLWQRFLDLFS